MPSPFFSDTGTIKPFVPLIAKQLGFQGGQRNLFLFPSQRVFLLAYTYK